MREIQPDQRAKYRQRQRDKHDHSWPGTAEKDEHHHGGQEKAESGFLDKIANRLAHIDRLVHHHVEIDAFDALENRLELGFDSFDNCDRVRAWLPVDRDVNLPLALHADDVRLDLMRVFDFCDVADVGRRAVANQEWQII